MHWLLLLVRFVLRAIHVDEGNEVALAARIDGRIEQCRRDSADEESGWSLFAFWQRRNVHGGTTRFRARGLRRANTRSTASRVSPDGA